MKNQHNKSPIATITKDEKGRVLLHCEYDGRMRYWTFVDWGTELDRDAKLIKRAYYAGHTARVCLGIDPWPEKSRTNQMVPKDTRVIDSLWSKFIAGGMMPSKPYLHSGQ